MSQPPTLDYRTPSSRPPDRGGAGWYLIGIATGLVISIVGWPTLAKTASRMPSGDMTGVLVLGLVLIPLIKCVLGAVVSRSNDKSTFMSGIITSIALAPLVGIGLVYAACAGWF